MSLILNAAIKETDAMVGLGKGLLTSDIVSLGLAINLFTLQLVEKSMLEI